MPLLAGENNLLSIDEYGITFGSTGVLFAPTVLEHSASIDSGTISITLKPNLTPPADITDNGGSSESFIQDFSAQMWVVNNFISKAKTVSLDFSSYNSSGINFNIQDIDLVSPEWYDDPNGVYKLAFKLSATLYLGSDGDGNSMYRTYTRLFSYRILGNSTKKMLKNITPFKNKLLNGECVSLDCSQVQAFCDSLTDC
jgi:hypothetical protein